MVFTEMLQKSGIADWHFNANLNEQTRKLNLDDKHNL